MRKEHIISHINVGLWFFCMLFLIPSFFTDGIILIDYKNVTAIEVIFMRSYLIPSFARIEVIEMQFSDWYYFVLPILLCSPTIILFIDSIRNRNYQFYLIRENINLYFISTSIASVVSAILMLFCSTIVFIIIVSIIFPHQGTYGGVLIDVDSSQYINYVMKYLHEVFYVFLIASISYFLSLIFLNKYVVITMTFLINYLVFRYIEKLEIVFLTVIAFALLFLSYRLLIRRCLNR